MTVTHAMIRGLLKVVTSRFVGFVLVAILAFSVVMLARDLVARWGPTRDANLVEIPQPNLERAEAIVRRHVQEVRQRCEAIVASRASTPAQRGRGFGELGKVYLMYQLPESAVACFRNAATLEPDQFRWPYYLAHSLKDDGKNAEAAPPMATALKLMANDATATAVDEHAALCTLADLAIRLNKPADARRTLEMALKVHPNSTFALVKLGQLAAQEGSGDQAISAFEKALAARPDLVAIRRLLAAEYRRRGDLAKVAQLAVPNDTNRKDKVLGFADPLYAAVAEQDRSGARQNRLGVGQLDVGRVRRALDHFARGVQADPGSAMLRFNHGSALLAVGRVDEGRKELEEASRLDADSDPIRAELYLALARLPATRQLALEKVIAWRKDQPGKRLPLRVLAEVQARLVRYQDALGTYVDLEKIDPTQPGPRIGQARMLAALGKGKDARRKLEEAVELFADDADTAVNLARLLATCRDETVRDGAKSLTIIQRLIASEYTVIRGETLALALAETGQYDKALEVQRKAIAECGDEGDVMVRRRLQGVLHALEQKKPWREPWPFREPNADDSTVAQVTGPGVTP